jgi:hypothetical protein
MDVEMLSLILCASVPGFAFVLMYSVLHVVEKRAGSWLWDTDSGINGMALTAGVCVLAVFACGVMNLIGETSGSAVTILNGMIAVVIAVVGEIVFLGQFTRELDPIDHRSRKPKRKPKHKNTSD